MPLGSHPAMDRRRFLLTSLAGALAAPLAAGAQQTTKKIPRVGFVSSGKWVPPDHPYLVAIRDGLSDAGYVLGKTVLIDWQSAENDYSKLPELVTHLLNWQADVLLCATTPDVLAAKKATSTTPIIMLGTGDPVAMGFAESLARPGGNITGLSPNHAELAPKRLQLAGEVARRTPRLGVFVSTGRVALLSGNPGAALQLRAVEAAAAMLGIELFISNVTSRDGFERAFKVFSQKHANGVLIIPDPLAWDYRKDIGDLAIKARLPTVGQDRQFAEAGILMTYGVNEVRFWRRAGPFIDRILKGARPADLPIEQPTEFELVINLKTAKALGLTIPPSLLARADQVIE
jgi:putative ABC transport system substrate-binding protein